MRYTPEYSFEDYELWEGQWELWAGVPVSMSPSPIARHQLISGNLFSILKSAVQESNACDCVILFKTDWRLQPNTVVRPDLSVLCKGVPQAFMEDPPALIVEVLSPSTEHKDRTAKMQLYQDQRVQVYVIADPALNNVEAFQLHDGKYTAVSAQDGVLPVQWRDGSTAQIHLSEVVANT